MGAIVMYTHSSSKDPAVEPFRSPALVQAVSDKGEVSLCVFSIQYGMMLRKTSEQGDKVGQWDWLTRHAS